MVKKNIFIMVMLMAYSYNKCQSIVTDSKGNAVLTYYSTASGRFDFSGDEFSGTYSFDPITVTLNDWGSDSVNVEKKFAWYLNPSLITGDESIEITSIKDFQPGAKMIFGRQLVVDHTTAVYNGPTYGCGFNGYFSFDNFKYYNPGNNDKPRRYPLSYGLTGNFTWFPGDYLPVLPQNLLIANATADIGWGWNESELKNFKEDGDIETLQNGVAFNDFDGKYGDLHTQMFKTKLTGSLLVVVPEDLGFLSHVCFGPYGEFIYNSYDRNNYFTGFFINFLAEPIDYKKFRMPSTLGFIFEWNDKTSGPLVSFRGSISIGEF